MGTLIKYRDLPGGPKEIKFADEINRTCLCGKCGMLSTSMYRDPADHIFCEACLRAQSKQHGQSDIYCEYECRFIDINEMEEAFDLVTMLRDQYVQCPNRQRCGNQVHFQDLKKHYIECQPEVPCSTCGSQVVSKDWEEHKNACSLTDKDKGPSKKSLTSRQAEQNPSSPCSLKQDVPLAGNTTKFQNSSALTSHLYPFDKLNEVAESTAGFVEDDNVEPASKAARFTSQARPEASGSHTVECPYCRRKVKDTNKNVHLKRCPKSPIPCGYCSTFIFKEDKTIHEEMCKSNAKKSMAAQSLQTEDFPPLQPERADGGKEEPATSGKNTHSSGSKANAWSSKQGSISKQRGSGSNLPQSKGSKKETPAQRETVTTDKPGNETKKKGTRDAADDPDERSAIARPNYNAHSAYSPSNTSAATDVKAASVKESSSCVQVVSERLQTVPNSDTWLAYMSIGDWLNAFVMMEEMFRAEKTPESDRYVYLYTGLVALNLDSFVQDLLEDPSKKNPFDCLMIALLARVCLSKHVRARREEVTWEIVLDYVPTVMKARLHRTTKSYLKKYPVFISKSGSSEVDEEGVEADKLDWLVSHLPSSSFNLQTAESGPKCSQEYQEQSPDTAHMTESTDESLKQQGREAEPQNFERSYLHYECLQKRDCKGSASSVDEKGAKKDSDDVNSMDSTNDHGSCQETGRAACSICASTGNVFDTEVDPSSFAPLSTKDNKPETNKEQSNCTDIERIVSESLALPVSRFSEASGSSMETPCVSEDQAEIEGNGNAQCKGDNGSSGPCKELCSSSCSSFEYVSSSSLHYTESRVHPLGHLLTEKEERGNCVIKPEREEENISEEKGAQNVSPRSSAGDGIYTHVRIEKPGFPEGPLERMPRDDTSATTESSHECKRRSSDLARTTDSRSLLIPNRLTDTDKARTNGGLKMLREQGGNQVSNVMASQAGSHQINADYRVLYSKRCKAEMTAPVCEEAKRFQQVFKEDSVVQKEIIQIQLPDNVDQGHCFQQEKNGSRSKAPQLSRYQSPSSSSVAGEAMSESTPLKSEFKNDESETRNSTSVQDGITPESKEEQLHTKATSQCLNAEAVMYEEKRHDMGFRADSMSEEEEAGGQMQAAASHPLSQEGDPGCLHSSTTMFISGGDSFAEDVTTPEFHVNSWKPNSAICRDVKEKMSTFCHDMLANAEGDLCSFSQGWNRTHETQRNLSRAASVRTPPSGRKTTHPEFGSADNCEPQVHLAEGYCSIQYSHKSTKASAYQRGQYQVNIPCGPALHPQRINTESSIAERCSPQTIGAIRAKQAIYRRIELSAPREESNQTFS